MSSVTIKSGLRILVEKNLIDTVHTVVVASQHVSTYYYFFNSFFVIDKRLFLQDIFPVKDIKK